MVKEYHHVKPGKGSAFVRVRIKNIKTEQVLERTFKSSDSLEDVPLEERRLQNLYISGDDLYLMDNTSYEEIIVPKSLLGDDIRFLQDHMELIALFYHNKVLKLNLPTFIQAEVKETEPGFKGDSTKPGTKSAQIDTGATVQVPLFIDVGEWVKIDTRTGQYVERVKR